VVYVVRVTKGSSFGGHPLSLLLTIFSQLVGVVCPLCPVLFNYLSAGGGGHLSSLILTIFPELMGVICQVLFLLSFHRWWGDRSSLILTIFAQVVGSSVKSYFNYLPTGGGGGISV
jgi:hypothetical protein